jgi:hypothetical protein
MLDQRTSETTQLTSDGVARQLGRQVEDATRNYRGGTEKAELAKGHPDFNEQLYGLYDKLAAEQALRLPVLQRPAWKTIKLGTGLKTSKDFINAIEKAGGKVSDWARNILGRKAFTASAEPMELDLVVVSVAELGFPGGATLKDIYAKAKTFGLELCPCEVGPQLRPQYMDQPNGEWLLVAMEPITASDGGPDVFSVAHGGFGRWLSTNSGYPGYVWSGSRRWVFVRRK